MIDFANSFKARRRHRNSGATSVLDADVLGSRPFYQCLFRMIGFANAFKARCRFRNSRAAAAPSAGRSRSRPFWRFFFWLRVHKLLVSPQMDGSVSFRCPSRRPRGTRPCNPIISESAYVGRCCATSFREPWERGQAASTTPRILVDRRRASVHRKGPRYVSSVLARI